MNLSFNNAQYAGGKQNKYLEIYIFKVKTLNVFQPKNDFFVI